MSDYVNKGPKVECLRLDISNKTQYVYLTYMIDVTDDLTQDIEARDAEETTVLGPGARPPM